MQDNFTESRNLNSTAVPGLSDEAREAVNAAFDAMSTWRVEAAKRNEKHSQEVIEKMAVAARALGWPEQIVDTTRAQLQSITKLQVQILDNMMDVWEEQIKSPNPMTASSVMLSKLKSWPDAKPDGAWPAGAWPNADSFAGPAMNPMHFWMQMAEQWQKAWVDAMGVGASGGQRRR
jgi:hypothetical protein